MIHRLILPSFEYEHLAFPASEYTVKEQCMHADISFSLFLSLKKIVVDELTMF